MKILTLQEAKDKELNTFEYDNRDYKYKDENEIWHLIRDGKELVQGYAVHTFDIYVVRSFNNEEYAVKKTKGSKWIFYNPQGEKING